MKEYTVEKFRKNERNIILNALGTMILKSCGGSLSEDETLKIANKLIDDNKYELTDPNFGKEILIDDVFYKLRHRMIKDVVDYVTRKNLTKSEPLSVAIKLNKDTEGILGLLAQEYGLYLGHHI